MADPLVVRKGVRERRLINRLHCAQLFLAHVGIGIGVLFLLLVVLDPGIAGRVVDFVFLKYGGQ